VQQTERTRRELFRVVSDEIKGVLKKTDLTRELRRALQGMKVQVRAEIRFVDEREQAEVNVEGRVASAKAARPTRKKKPRR
jgi:hypothetical protein